MHLCPRCIKLVETGDACGECGGPLDPVELHAHAAGSFERAREALSAWRAQQASLQRVERYMVVPNRALAHLAARQPEARESILDVPGIGPAKAHAYGYVLTRYFCELHAGREPEQPLVVQSPVPEGLSPEQEDLLFAIRTLEGPLAAIARARAITEDELVARLEALVRRGCADVVHLLSSPLDLHLVARYLREHPGASAAEVARALPHVGPLACRLVPLIVERPASG